MLVIPTGFPGLLLLEPTVFGDDRGYFYESYNEQTFNREGIHYRFVQDNQAFSCYGVVRGLHFQKGEDAQTKLVRAIRGTVLDVVVDLRTGSPTFGKSYSAELSAENKRQLLVPQGFAHGYAVLSTEAEVLYKCDRFYNKAAEGGLAFNDPALNIDWKIPEEKMILSEKDKQNALLADCGNIFFYKP
jgi:dTDP-4-dehydrorhamnose 3,5-epimerase